MANEVSNGMVGRVLAQRYRLIDKLGEGGMGSVWRAEHLELGTLVAVKLISREVANNPDALERFRREAHAAAALRSPHVVQILDYGVDGNTPFMVMELLEGESLAERLARRGSLGMDETSRILSQVARAVSKAHSFGIVHRDLKPDNIFLVHNDDEEVAKVLDFGIAKATGDVTGSASMMTGTGVMLGTPYYMSPEQAAGRRDVDHRTDTWALAVIAYQCLVGSPPFRADTIGGLVLAICTEQAPRPSQHASLAPSFDAWFARGVQRDPEQRFQTARDLADTLKAIAGGHGVPETLAFRGSVSGAFGVPPTGVASSAGTSAVSTTAQGTSMTQSVFKPPPRGRSLLLIAASVLVPTLAVAGYAAYSGLGMGEPSNPASTASLSRASEPPAAVTVPHPSAAASAPKAPKPEVSVSPEPEMSATAPAVPERAAGVTRMRQPKASTARKAAASPAKPEAERVHPPPAAAPTPEPPQVGTSPAKPSASPAKPAEKTKIDLAF